MSWELAQNQNLNFRLQSLWHLTRSITAFAGGTIKKNLNLILSPVSGPDIPSRHKSICPVTCILQRAGNLQGFARALLLTLHTPLGSAFESQSEENGAWAWHEGIIPAKRKKFNRFSLRKDGVGGGTNKLVMGCKDLTFVGTINP